MCLYRMSEKMEDRMRVEGEMKRWSISRREYAVSALCPLVCQEMSGCIGGGMVMAAVGRSD